jgi:PAS domain S-box-containing protein
VLPPSRQRDGFRAHDFMNEDQFTQQVQSLHRRMRSLYQSVDSLADRTALLQAAFEELQTALEILETADRELRRKGEALQQAIDQAEIERRRYVEVFASIPEGYLVTSIEGTIRQANPAAGALLGIAEKFLVGRSLALFIPDGARRAFRTRLHELYAAEQPQRLRLRVQPSEGAPFDANLTVGVVRGTTGRPLALHWLVRAIDDQHQGERELEVGGQRLDLHTGPTAAYWGADGR